ncbi:MAG: hypothetical protein JHD15_21515 [Phenylobacterium sp.]|uniref:hypothetical protein n=1 Tax=Phenylobacterium sp. TaxID=1871053 RepID=UPI001A183BC3|nr:hypothetical protein [Phenylobacterium sp.]MBJ7412914.1 hypothetical protein [Phenylobacterium sp.]
MRLRSITAALLLASATTAAAAPASVTVAVAPELQKKFDKTYGQREAAFLTADLREAVEEALAKTAAYDGARVELTLVDVKPNRPTFKQLSDTPGLSFESFGVGGAAIEGRVIGADGAETKVDYKWFETDIRQAHYNWVWSDAEWTFDRFARRLARGQEVAGR